MDAADSPALYSRFLRGLALSQQRVAFRAGNEQVSYARAHETALLWAGSLVRARAGASAGAVGVLAAKGSTAYIGILAALYAGAAVVPLRLDFPAARTRHMLAASGATGLIADAGGLAKLPELLPVLDGVTVVGPSGPPDGGAPVPVVLPTPQWALERPRAVGSDDPAYILFTSGSTGNPKGVVITHGNTGHYFRHIDERYDFTPADVFSQAFDLNFDCSLFDLFCAWGAGATSVAVPSQAYRDLPAFLTAQGVTVWFSTPSAIDLVRRMGGLAAGAMPGLRRSFFAGEAFMCGDAADWSRAAPDCVIENLYGPTELTVTIAAHRWSEESSPRLAVNGVVPVGALHAGHDQLLLGDDGQPNRTEGELCVAGPQLTPGYLDPRDERGRFLDRDHRRWYRTGDRVRQLDGGALAYLGRLDSQVQIQGWRIELGEVEHALRDCGVRDAVALGVPVDAGTELFAFYTGRPLPAAQLVHRLRQLLPDGAIPKHYRHLERFPLNTNRKIDRSSLAAQANALLSGARRARGQ